MHLTVRMAWHDSGWNGRVCKDPRANTYCTGAHSLLSGRLEKKKNVEVEQKKCGKPVAGNFPPAGVPPCFWSINAFGDKRFEVEHHHAFTKRAETIAKLKDWVEPYSVFTWPFKLSFVHGKDSQKRHGNYPPDLNKRVAKFIKSFEPRQSVLFFYANYDNPVSADEMRYLLIGCALIAKVPTPKHFPFTEREMEDWRGSSKAMKNFPTMNWALQFTHDPATSVMLPYAEYVAYGEKHPEDADKLDEMKVVIEEESLVRGFKYVAMDIDDDKCLYLLYKLRKAIKKIQEHDRLVVDRDMLEEERRVEALIKGVWDARGIYPSLGKVLNHFLEDEERSNDLAVAMATLATPKSDLLALLKRIADDVPTELEDYEDDLADLSDKRSYSKHLLGLARLSLFNLTQHQVTRIIEDGDLLDEVGRNPYCLYEGYEADDDDLDIPQLQDEPIDVYKVDIAMVPDRRFVKRHRGLQDLAEDSPQRVRSVYINYLKRIAAQGDCYDHTHNLISELRNHPLIYKIEGITIDEQALVSLESDYKSHFIEKLHIQRGEALDFYYLREVFEAEQRIKAICELLMGREDHATATFDVQSYVQTALQSEDLQRVISGKAERTLFTQERQQLYRDIFRKSFFLLTGKPGAGKTFETTKIVEHLASLNEEVVILTPTGKAALRVTENLKLNTMLHNMTARTIDKYLFDAFPSVMTGERDVTAVEESEKITVENLIIDESSMVDLAKLDLLLSVIKVSDKYPKRLILVGDENQLPPIGAGKPFHDMIGHVLANSALSEAHYINLKSNCRQENDPRILALADAFTDRRRGYEESLSMLEQDGWVSDGLFVQRWSTPQELNAAIEAGLKDLFEREGLPSDLPKAASLNRLFGLYDNGYVNNHDFAFRATLKLEAFQLLTPYRSGFYGTLGLNKAVQAGYREKPTKSSHQSQFYHSDKIIRLNNWYQGWGSSRRLVLSNGSIGICKGDEFDRKYYFRELDRPRTKVGSEEDYDLAYAISVHRAQGSDFRNVFLVVPERSALLSRELVYTALTRSKVRLFLFLQNSQDNILLRARGRSHLLNRNTSIFSAPADRKAKLVPGRDGRAVQSRIEYIIHQSLQRSGLPFTYEEPLKLAKRDYSIKPDFTIKLRDGKTIYWEHLGMLDTRKYYKDWQRRIVDYKDHGLFEHVVTTDDLDGIKQERIDAVIEAIRSGSVKTERNHRFSDHHYELY